MLFSFWASKNPGKALEKNGKTALDNPGFLNFWRRTNPVKNKNTYLYTNKRSEKKMHLRYENCNAI